MIKVLATIGTVVLFLLCGWLAAQLIDIYSDFTKMRYAFNKEHLMSVVNNLELESRNYKTDIQFLKCEQAILEEKLKQYEKKSEEIDFNNTNMEEEYLKAKQAYMKEK